MSALIAVKHNIEVAHRLYSTPGKCENIHGHSMWVTMFIEGEIDKHGMLDGLDFGEIKKNFRGFLDEEYDHRILLNAADPFAGPIIQVQPGMAGGGYSQVQQRQRFLPGLNTMNGDPTTENIARAVYQEMFNQFPVKRVEVWETAVNMASYGG